MGKRKPIHISQCLTITSQGVLDDYINAWSGIAAANNLYLSAEDGNPLSSDDKECIKKVLGMERQPYLEYIHQKHRDIEAKIINNSNMEAVSALNNLADCYNLIRKRIAKDFNIPLAMKFVELAAFMIQGKESSD